MKQRITVEDLKSLTPEQKQNLNSLWKPSKFDHAVASICKDIINEEYEDYEFVIGDIEIYNGYRFLLHDITHMSNENPDDSESTDETSQNDDENYSNDEDSYYDEDEDENEYEDEDEDEYDNVQEEVVEDYDENFSDCRPSSFIKDECLPLLSIGQMIEILSKTAPSHDQFYILAETDDLFCEIGNKAVSNKYGFQHENDELCDVLWELVKKTL